MTEKLQMKALREWRHEMKGHWKKLGGEQNLEAANRRPYKNVDLEDWKFLCEFFSSEKQKVWAFLFYFLFEFILKYYLS